jgi:hypothetical protein
MSLCSSFWCESIKFTALERSEDLPDIRAGSGIVKIQKFKKLPAKYFREVCDLYFRYRSGLRMEDCPRLLLLPVIAGILTVVLWIAPCLYFLDETTWRSVALPLYRRDYSLSGIDISIVSERGLYRQFGLLGATALYDNECEWDSGSAANVVSTVLVVLYRTCGGSPTASRAASSRDADGNLSTDAKSRRWYNGCAGQCCQRNRRSKEDMISPSVRRCLTVI